MNVLAATIGGQDLKFFADRGLYWPAQGILAITDLHLGKAETFQQNGMWLPEQAQMDDLNRLSRLIDSEDCRGCKKLFILGDLIHTKKGITAELQAKFADWLHRHDVEVHLLLGNHDRHFAKTWPKAWDKVVLADTIRIGNFRFQHELEIEEPTELPPNHFTWLGHLHPMIRIQDGPDRLRLPCFHISKSIGHVPAFSSLAGGENIHARLGDRVFATSIEDNWIGEI